MLLQRLLKFYLDSELFFGVYVDMFFEDVHFGVCGKGRYPFKSQIYRNIEDRLKKDGGYELILSDKKIRKYFTHLKNESQLSAVIFAEWYGLNRKQIRCVADRRSPYLSWQKLNYFLCNPTSDTFPGNYDCRWDMKKLVYYIEKGTEKVTARYYTADKLCCENGAVSNDVLIGNDNMRYIFCSDRFYDI